MQNENIFNLSETRRKYLIILCLEDLKDDFVEDLRKKTLEGTHYYYAKVLASSFQPDWLPAVEGSEKNVKDSVDEESSSGLTVQEQAAETLHSLADKLPVKGTQLDLLWFVPSASSVQVRENAALLGALKRLQVWHGAHVTLLQDSDHNKSALNGWLSALEASYAVISMEQPDVSRDGVAWRGRLRLAEGKSNASLSLPGFQLSMAALPKADVPVWCSRVSREETETTQAVFDDTIDVVDIVQLDQVPRCLLLSEQFILSVPAVDCLPRSSELLGWLTAERHKDQLGLIVQLSFRVYSSTVPTATSAGLGSEEWKEQISKDCMNHEVPDVALPSISDGSCLFLLYRSQSGECCARQFVPLSELNGAIPAQLAKMENLGAFSLKPGSIKGLPENPLNDLLLMEDIKLQRLVESVAEAQLEGLKHYAEQKLKADQGLVLSPEEVKRLLFQIRRNCLRSLDLQELSADKPEAETNSSIPTLHHVYTDPDPSEIPERLALINGEVVREKMRREKSKDFQLAGMVVPLPVHDTITLHLNASEFLKHFHPSGLPTGQDFSPIGIATKSRLSTPSKLRSKPQYSEEDLKGLDFEASMRHDLPGVHYCTGHDSLSLDTKMARLIQRVVPMETATTCSQKDTVSVIKLRRKRRSLSKSPTKKLVTTPRKSKSKQLGRTPKSLKRPRRATTGNTPVKRAKKSTPSTTAEEIVSPRKSLRLATPLKARSDQPYGNDALPSPKRSQRLLTPKKNNLLTPTKKDQPARPPETTPRRSSRLATPTKSEPSVATPTKRTPQKKTGRTPRKAPGSQSKRSTPSKRRAMSLSDTASQRSRKMSRSEKHKKKLMEIVNGSLLSKGVEKSHPCYKRCYMRLFELTKSYVKDLKTSKGLYEEMKQISDSNVDFVVRFELKSKSTSS